MKLMNRHSPALFFCALMINLVLTAAAGAQGGMPIHVPLQQAESDYFIYIYDCALKDQIPGLMKHCEDAHAVLAPAFQWIPRRKTIVMFCDAQDFHNGWATVYPRPMIMVYASAAPPESTITSPAITDLAASCDRTKLYYTRLDIQGRDRIRMSFMRWIRATIGLTGSRERALSLPGHQPGRNTIGGGGQPGHAADTGPSAHCQGRTMFI